MGFWGTVGAVALGMALGTALSHGASMAYTAATAKKV